MPKQYRDSDDFTYSPHLSVIKESEAEKALNVIIRQARDGKIDEWEVPVLIDMIGLAHVTV